MAYPTREPFLRSSAWRPRRHRGMKVRLRRGDAREGLWQFTAKYSNIGVLVTLSGSGGGWARCSAPRTEKVLTVRAPRAVRAGPARTLGGGGG